MNKTLYDRCSYSSTNQNTIVYILDSSFNEFSEIDNSGGAAFVEKSAMLCRNSNFTNCNSVTGGGGAIYIKNNKDQLENNITFVNNQFDHCTAIFGGAAYIYSSSETNGIIILQCIFKANKATSQKSDTSLFGGNSLFLTVKSANISRS